MPATATPSITFVSPREAEALAARPDVLALVRFGGRRDAGNGTTPWLDTGLEPLGEGEAPVQCWRVDGPVRRERRGRFAVHATRDLALLATTLSTDGDPAPAAEAAYAELVATAEAIGCPHFLRIWQYLPRITDKFADEDRYKRFCAGRRRALEAARRPDSTLPAACLLGDAGDSMLLYALVAADTPGTQVENPRQVSAFRYPPQYGRAAPSFSRALAWHPPGGDPLLYISGTASVVGHASVHTETTDQLAETLRNLEALLEEGRRRGGPDATGLASIAPLKVYVRRREDFPAVRAGLAERLPADHPVVYLRADVCRPELMVEIEGIASGPSH